MTTAIAACTSSSEYIVTVSDARLSHGEAIPADDEATMKSRKIAHKWGMMFAAEDSTAFLPVVGEVYLRLKGKPDDPPIVDHDADIVSNHVQEAYEKEFHERFFREHLARFRYVDVADFRRHGFQEMGKDLYGQYADALARFDLGLELIVYGFDGHGGRHLFEIANPGKIINHNLRGYTAVGSGSMMALAALTRKRIVPGLSETIYRLLDAKFSSETAREVGKKTYVIIANKSGRFEIMPQKDIAKIRAVWEEIIKQQEPEEALDLIDKSKAVIAISGGEP